VIVLNECACDGRNLPRLLRPWILTVLAGGEAHGYEIAQRLAQTGAFADREPDTAGLYRALGDMAGQGLLTARWETGAGGPARKVFALTAEGWACLRRWQASLTEFRGAIDALLARLEPPGQDLAA
jgi:DNA-binding PadR family transcriptional regulator